MASRPSRGTARRSARYTLQSAWPLFEVGDRLVIGHEAPRHRSFEIAPGLTLKPSARLHAIRCRGSSSIQSSRHSGKAGHCAPMVSMAAAAAAGSQQSSRLSSPSLAPAAKASYQRHDGRFPAFIRTSRHGFEAPIGCPVHAAWPGREFIHQTLGATKPAPDLAREPVRALGGTLELRLIAKAIAMTASKPRSTIQNAASTGTRWARKPSSAVAECCSRNQEADDLVDNLQAPSPVCAR